MVTKKTLKLINDERTLLSVRNALACDSTSFDGGCVKGKDNAFCTIYAADGYCSVMDLAACSQGADDYCLTGTADTVGCYGPGSIDNPNED